MARMVSEDFIGTCQWCFGEYKVNNNRTVVLHGYQRPGHGHTVGNCPGYGHQPFEYEHSLTEERIAQIRASIANNEKQLKHIDDGKVVKLGNPNYVPQEKRRANGWYGREADIQTYTKEEHPKEFDRLLRAFRASIENEIRFERQIADYLDDAVKAWTKKPVTGLDTPATGKQRYLRGAYDPDKAKEAEELAARKAERAAKPGKLMVTVYARLSDNVPFADPRNPTEAEWQARRDMYDAHEVRKKEFRTNLKKWTQANFPADKYWVGDVYDGDITWRKRKDLQGKNIVAAATKIDWKYLDTILDMFPATSPLIHRDDNGPKDIRIFVDIDDFPADL